VTPAIRDTVAAVHPGETVSQVQLAARLGLEASTVSWRVNRAIKGGFLENEETRRGHPAKLKLGDPLPDEATALPPVEAVREAFESRHSGGNGSETGTYGEDFDSSNESGGDGGGK